MTSSSLLASIQRKQNRKSLFREKLHKVFSSWKRDPSNRRRKRTKRLNMEHTWHPEDSTKQEKLVVDIDKPTQEVMRLEVSNLLAESGGKVSVHTLACTLMRSHSVAVMQNTWLQEESLVHDLALLSLKSSALNNEQQPSFRKALHSLEVQVGSTSQQVSNWQQAKTVLSTVLAFPCDDQDKEKPSNDDKMEPKTPTSLARTKMSPEVHRYMKQIQQATRRDARREVEFRSYSKFQQVALSPLPTPDLVVEEEEQRQKKPAIAEVDALHTRRLQDAYRDQENRRTRQVVKDFEHEQEAQKKASSLLRPLSEKEQAIVRDAMYSIGPEEQVMAQVGTDSVQRGSMHRLQPGQWLNDEVIHYFMIMLANRDEQLSKADPTRKRSHFFKSFFITKLLNVGNADPDKDGKYNYTNVKRWSKRVPGKDVFNLDKIVFPINVGGVHWICLVVFMQEKRIQVYDSMKSSGTYYLNSIFQYLQDEHLAKKSCQMPNLSEWELIGTTEDTPQQQNGFDCGVFTCMFADFLSTDCPLVFSQQHITQCRERIALSIMNGSAII